MSLIGKLPVDKPCEAETFEDAAYKNRVRLAHELDLCKSLREQMEKDGDKDLSHVDPEFWRGALGANEQAAMVYNNELEEFRKRVAKQLKQLPVPVYSPAYVSGFRSIKDSWVQALERNNPSTIVYW